MFFYYVATTKKDLLCLLPIFFLLTDYGRKSSPLPATRVLLLCGCPGITSTMPTTRSYNVATGGKVLICLLPIFFYWLALVKKGSPLPATWVLLLCGYSRKSSHLPATIAFYWRTKAEKVLFCLIPLFFYWLTTVWWKKFLFCLHPMFFYGLTTVENILFCLLPMFSYVTTAEKALLCLLPIIFYYKTTAEKDLLWLLPRALLLTAQQDVRRLWHQQTQQESFPHPLIIRIQLLIRRHLKCEMSHPDYDILLLSITSTPPSFPP